tara:strand:+ start:1863 stop:2660 length:798 start_codon:yes stop_codon:yes gene_type:complete
MQLFLTIGFLSLFITSAQANTWQCSHPQACNLVHDYIKSTNSPLPSFEKAIKIVKDPHHIEPNAKEIKAMYKAQVFITAPMPLNPWAKSVLKMRREQNAKVIELMSPITKDKEALAHFWLYPEIACQLWTQVHEQLKLQENEPACPYNFDFKQTGKTEFPIIISHDAVVPMLKSLGYDIHAIKGSGHHEEPKPQQVKAIADTVNKYKKVVWIEENNIHFPHSIEKMQRSNDTVLEIDTNGDYPGELLAPLKNLLRQLEEHSNAKR